VGTAPVLDPTNEPTSVRSEEPEQLILPPAPAASTSRARIIPVPEQAARAYIARRAKPSVVPGHVKLTFTLDMRREVAGRLSVRRDPGGEEP
jgi:hypothetical protein